MFYTYMWLREDGSPYYVGKGKNRRAFAKFNHHCAPPKDKSRITIYPMPDQATAFAYEIYLIDFFGRKDLGTGCLRNMTDGGDGRREISPETRIKMTAGLRKPEVRAKASKRSRLQFTDPEQRYAAGNGNRGIKQTPERIAKSVEGRKGYTHSPETKARIAASLMGHVCLNTRDEQGQFVRKDSHV
jgi:hypothetical protein